MFNLKTIHSRHYAKRLIFHFFLVCAFSARAPKAFPAWMLPPNEPMVDPPDDLLVTIAEMEAFILYFLIVRSEIVASSADFSRFLLFHSFSIGTTPVLGHRDIAIVISCIASSADIFSVRFD